MKLESIEAQGQYLHCSNSTLQSYKVDAISNQWVITPSYKQRVLLISYLLCSYELNMSVFESTIMFHLHSSPSDISSSVILQVSATISILQFR